MALRQPLADIQFISDFAAFCRTKGDEGFSYYDEAQCALGLFGYRHGFVDPDIPESVKDAITDSDETFADVADRLEALLIDAPVVERDQ